jgi:hypothetical protein
VHSDVGGGFDDHPELGNVTIRWMLEGAIADGLLVREQRVKPLHSGRVGRVWSHPQDGLGVGVRVIPLSPSSGRRPGARERPGSRFPLNTRGRLLTVSCGTRRPGRSSPGLRDASAAPSGSGRTDMTRNPGRSNNNDVASLIGWASRLIARDTDQCGRATPA